MNQSQHPDPLPDTVSHSDRPTASDTYRTLADHMQQGFCLIDVLLEEIDQPLDFRFLDVNPVFEQLTGLVNAVGKTMRALQPAHEQPWFDLFARVVRTRQPVHLEQQAAYLADGVWYEVYAFPVGPLESHQVAILFTDITQRKQSQQQQAFLLKFSDTVRTLPNADAIATCALQGLAEQLQLDRCYIGVYRLAENQGEFTHQVGNDRVPPVPDHVRLSDFPDALRVAYEGTLVIDDVGKTAGLTQLDRQNLGVLGFSALVASTLRHGERNPLWSIVAVSARPRRWTPAEIKLIDEVTERTWDALERARATLALRESEARLGRELADTQHLQRISSRLIEADNMEGLYQQIMESSKAIMHSDSVSMQRYFGAQKALKLLAWQGLHPESAHYWEWVDMASVSPCGRALVEGKRVIVADVETEASLQGTADLEAFRKSGLRAVQTTPLISRSGQIVGMLSNHWKQVHRPTPRELGLLDVIARQAADFVERHQAAEALGQSEERFRTLVQNLPDYAIFRIDSDTIITEWTEGAQRIKGYTAQEAIGQPLALFYTPENLAAGELTNEVAEATRTGRAERESVRIRKGGGRFWVDEIMTAIHDEQGRLVGFTKISRDITERKKAAEALFDSRQRLQIVLDSIADHALITTDPQGRIVSWNPGARQMFGYSAEEAVGQSVAILFTPEDRAAGQVEQEMALARRQGQAPDERYHLRKDGSRLFVSGTQAPLYDADKTLLGYVKVARDLTDRQQMEQALREADRRKDEFLAMLAHELRNPLAPIRNGLQILSLTEGTNPDLAPLVALMSRQLTHLVRLVDDLLDVSRISQGKIELKREELDLGILVGGAVDAARPLYQTRGKALELELPMKPLLVDGDATRLAQVVTNLLTNGSRYTGEDGRVRVSLEAVQGEARLRVADNGIGLEGAQLEAIFELFVQVDTSVARSQGGLGLGLTLVKRLVELHGGRVEAHSAGLGQGSEFRVYLPLLGADKPQPAINPVTPHLTDQPSLLVIDDNADAALMLAMVLKLKGYRVHTRSSGRSGLEAAEQVRPAAILLDLGMPDLDGYETCRLLRQQPWGKAVPVIALTGYGQAEDRQRTHEAGFNAHLVKPVDLGTLTQLLTQLVSG